MMRRGWMASLRMMQLTRGGTVQGTKAVRAWETRRVDILGRDGGAAVTPVSVRGVHGSLGLFETEIIKPDGTVFEVTEEDNAAGHAALSGGMRGADHETTGGSQSVRSVTRLTDDVFEIDEESFFHLTRQEGGDFPMQAGLLGGMEQHGAVVAKVQELHDALEAGDASHEAWALEKALTGDADAARGSLEIHTRDTDGPGPEDLYAHAPGDSKVVVKVNVDADWDLSAQERQDLAGIVGKRFSPSTGVLKIVNDDTAHHEDNRTTALLQLNEVYKQTKQTDDNLFAPDTHPHLLGDDAFAVVDDDTWGVEGMSSVEDREEWMAGAWSSVLAGVQASEDSDDHQN